MARKSTPARPRPGGSFLWLQGLVCGAVLTFATPVALLLCILMAPGLAAAIFDSAPQRAMTRAVCLGCLAFTLGPVWRLILDGSGMTKAVDLALDPAIIGPAWLAGACGWALCEVLPVFLRIMADMRAAARVAALQKEEAELRELWDIKQADK
jgi:hypothetical protein